MLDAAGNPVTGAVGTGCLVRTSNGGVPVEMYTVVLYGDASGEGSINAQDLLLIKRHILAITPLAGAWLIAANVNRDDGVNALDILLEKRDILGITPILQSS